ncbi:MAG: DUF2490 domain-containing protein [Bacteroidales bacterium]|nr:DUF2490 domain-containing protein [Bacteroidales bacterium]MCF8456832.1 DUF2490 domain-containing protein [Bacteroidales bacterium]
MRLITTSSIFFRRIYFLLIVPALFLAPTTGQGQISDAKLWTGLKLEYAFSKKLEAACEIEQRFDNNISEFDRLLLEPSISYKINKKWGLEASYRAWARQSLEHNYDFRQRGNLDISFKKKHKSFDVKLTTGLQYGFPDVNQDYSNYSTDLVSRNSIRVGYDIFGSRFSPDLKYELFTKIAKGQLLNYQWRVTAATSYYINESVSLKFFYALEHEYNLDEPYNSHIYGVGLNYKL